jgi:hypothetical protein
MCRILHEEPKEDFPCNEPSRDTLEGNEMDHHRKELIAVEKSL